MITKLGFGGGCHWCTEAVFNSLKGVKAVEQGWISSDGENKSLSEAVIVTFNNKIISTEVLVKIHLHTHSSTSSHSMREKFRSAVYFFHQDEKLVLTNVISKIQKEFADKIVTQVLLFKSFKANREESLDYYFKDPELPFCQNYIDPKLKMLINQFSDNIASEKLQHLL